MVSVGWPSGLGLLSATSTARDQELCLESRRETLAVAGYDNRVRIFCSSLDPLVHDIDHVGACTRTRFPPGRWCHIESSVEAEVTWTQAGAGDGRGRGQVCFFISQTRYDTVDERPVYLDSRGRIKKAGPPTYPKWA